MFKILIFFWIFLLLISIFYVINNLMQKKENFNVSEVENDINSRNKIYLETNVIHIIPGKPGPTGEKGNDGDDGTEGLGGEDGLIGNSGNDGDDAAKVQFIHPDGSTIGEVSVRNPNTEDVHEIKIPRGKKGDRGDTRKLNFCYIYKNFDDRYNISDSNCYLEDPSEGADISKDMYLYIPKGKKGDAGDQGDCSMESPGFPGPTGDSGPDGDKGEKGPRGLEGKRGIDADRLNVGHNITGVEYKICFDDTPDNCIDVPKLKALNQDYQDKIDNRPYEDIISKTNNKYVPVLLRRINRLKNDLCLAHLIGDYSNGYLNDIKKDLDETYNVFNQQEGTEFKNLYNNGEKLDEYCSKFFNIVAVDFVFDKTDVTECTKVDLYTFIENYLKTQGKWDDRFNTYKNTPVINIIIDDKSTNIISNSIDNAALTIDVDKIFEIFPNIYEITLDVQRYITGKHEPSGSKDENWDDKTSSNLDGGNGESGKKGGPAIEIIYKNTNVLKKIVIKITENGGPGTKIAGGFGSLGGQGGKASKSFYKKNPTESKAKDKNEKTEKTVMNSLYEGNILGSKGYLNKGETAWVSGKRNINGKDYNYNMIIYGKHHLVSNNNTSDTITSEKNDNNEYWEFKKYSELYDGDDFNCKIYDAKSNNYNDHKPDMFNGFNFNKNPYITPKDTVCTKYEYNSNQGGGSKKCTKKETVEHICGDKWSEPNKGAKFYKYLGKLYKEIKSYTNKPCDEGWKDDPGNSNNCCRIGEKNECFTIEYWNKNGENIGGEPGKPKEGAKDEYNAKDKSTWTDYKTGERAKLPGYISSYPDKLAGFSDNVVGLEGLRGNDGDDGKIINTNIQDKSKVKIYLNNKEIYQ